MYKLSYVRADEILGVIRPVPEPRTSARNGSRSRLRIGSGSASRRRSSPAAAGESAGGGGAGGGRDRRPGRSRPSGGGPTIGGFQPPTGGNSLADNDHLIIQDYESNLQIIDQIIERIDVRPIQVLIEAVIISVDYEHDRELGVNFGLVDNLGQSAGHGRHRDRPQRQRRLQAHAAADRPAARSPRVRPPTRRVSRRRRTGSSSGSSPTTSRDSSGPWRRSAARRSWPARGSSC